MDSPPSSPVFPLVSPPSSPLMPNVSPASSQLCLSDSDVSPLSSPILEQNTPKKARSWSVFATGEVYQSTLGRENELLSNEPSDVEHEPELAELEPDPNLEVQPEQEQYEHIANNWNNGFYSGESSDSSQYCGDSSSDGNDSFEDRSVSSEEERRDCRTDSDTGDSDSETFNVYNGCKFNVDEAVLDLMSNNIENSETRKSLEDNLKTFLKYLPKNNSMPKTLDQLLNYVEQLAPSYIETAFPYCAQCSMLFDHDGKCKACEHEKRNYFYMYSLSEQIRFYFEHRNLAQILDSERCWQSRDGKIRDIVDGTQYRKATSNDKYKITLLMNTDGVAISNSSKTRVWPVMFVIAELPLHLRSKFLLVHGVWCDCKDPPMNTFLKPLVNDLIHINNEGGVEWNHPNSNVIFKSIITVPAICADAPARAKLQNISGHTGNQGCNTCEQMREKIPLTLQEAREKAAGANIRRKNGYMYLDQPAVLRSDFAMREQALQSYLTKKPVQGVKGPSILACIPHLDISRAVYAEYLHGICLGVVKHFLKLLLTVRGPWNISEYKHELDQFMRKIAPTDDICRLPRPVSDFLHWKGSEFRSWLLYYSLPASQGKLPHAYLQHWALLVKSIYLLLKEEISQDDIAEADIMLNIFVRDVGRLYRLRDNLYNVHQLLHLTLYVKWWGPLWENSAYLFESYNGTLAKLIHGTKNPGKELMRNIRIAHGVLVLRMKVLSRKNVETVPRGKSFEALNICRDFNISDSDKAILFSSDVHLNQSAAVHARVKQGRVMFTSKVYCRSKKRGNYTVKFESSAVSGFGDIKYFVVSEDDIFAVVEKLRVDHTKVFVTNRVQCVVNHIIPIIDEGPALTIVLNVKDITVKMIRVGSYLSYRPNHFETNL